MDCFTLVTGMLHLASSQMKERDIYCLSFLPSYPQTHCSQSVSHMQPRWVMPTACPAAAPSHIISGSHEAQSGTTTSLHLPVSRDQHDKHLLLVCSLVPSPSSYAHTDVCFCLNKKNLTLLLVFLTYRSFKWMS